MTTFFVGLCVTLVVAQIIGAVIMTVASFKIVSSKWFMKKYMAWVAEMTVDMNQ